MKQHLVMFLAYVHRPDLLFNYLEKYQALRAATAHTSLCSTASDSGLGLSCSFDWAGGLQRVFHQEQLPHASGNGTAESKGKH